MLTGRRWKIATLRGIPLYVSTSWVWIAAIYVWSVYDGLVIGGIPVRTTEAVLLAVFAAALFFGSVLIHETAHAVMARSLDLPVRAVTLVFWGLQGLCWSLGLTGKLPPAVAAWAPDALFLAAGAVLTRRLA